MEVVLLAAQAAVVLVVMVVVLGLVWMVEVVEVVSVFLILAVLVLLRFLEVVAVAATEWAPLEQELRLVALVQTTPLQQPPESPIEAVAAVVRQTQPM
jgi:hypothetical protein